MRKVTGYVQNRPKPASMAHFSAVARRKVTTIVQLLSRPISCQHSSPSRPVNPSKVTQFVREPGILAGSGYGFDYCRGIGTKQGMVRAKAKSPFLCNVLAFGQCLHFPDLLAFTRPRSTGRSAGEKCGRQRQSHRLCATGRRNSCRFRAWQAAKRENARFIASKLQPCGIETLKCA